MNRKYVNKLCANMEIRSYIQTLCSSGRYLKEIVSKFFYKTGLANDPSDDAGSFFLQQPDENLAKRSSCGLFQIARFPAWNCWRLDKFITKWIARPLLMFVAQFISLRFSFLREKGIRPSERDPNDALNEHSLCFEPCGCQRIGRVYGYRLG